MHVLTEFIFFFFQICKRALSSSPLSLPFPPRKRRASSSSSSLNSSIIGAARKMRRILQSDDDESNGWGMTDIINEYIPSPPPRLLESTRIFLSCGWMEIGFSPSSDGYGNADVTITIVIMYRDEWICFTDTAFIPFFNTLREANSLPIVDHTSDFSTDKFDMIREGDFFKITLSGAEGKQEVINQFVIEDVHLLLNKETSIASKIDIIRMKKREIVETIEDTAERYRGNVDGILLLTENMHCNGIIFEIGVNHFKFFTDFVAEIIKNTQMIL